jgi:transcription elongation factor Elf1
MDEVFIKEKILELKRQIKYYEKELTKVCQHEKTSLMFDKYSTRDKKGKTKYIFICDNCGMTFITNDPNFKYEET